MAGEELNASALVNRTIALLRSCPVPTALYVLGIGGLDLLTDIADSSFAFGMLLAGIFGSYLLTRSILSAAGFQVQEKYMIGAFFGVGFLSGLGILFGFLFLIIPGVILWVRWLPAYGILVAEETSAIEALNASWQRTYGNFWPLFAASAVYAAFLLFAVLIYGSPDIFPEVPRMLALVVGNFLVGLSGAIGVAFGIASYLLLGPQGPDGLEQVFA